jgi:hypothetical protein
MLLSAPVCCDRDSSDVDVTLTGGTHWSTLKIVISPLQPRLPNHGGLTPAAPGNVRSCIAKGVLSPANDPQPRAGGVSPPWRINACNGSHSALVSADANHGGLTPAAPGTVRSCIAKGVISPANDRAATKSGGRQPPVALINANATAIRTHTVGGLPTNGARVCRCAFAHPRRADARRSWLCAFVHRKRRRAHARRFRAGIEAFFHRSCCNTRAGGVSPPWPAIVRDTTNRRNTIAAGNRIRTSDWEKADTQRQRLHRGPLRSKPPEVEPFHTPGETDRCVFTPYIPRQPRLRGPAIHLPKPLAALLRHIFGMAGVKATLRNWGGGYNGMLSRVP